VGVYIDGYNLYYGGRGLLGGAGLPGWKWLNLRQLSQDILAAQSGWTDPRADRVVYCTARIRGANNQSGSRDQDTYLRALRAHSAVDVIEYGTYVTRVATNPLATRDRKGRPVLVRPDWPVMVQNDVGQPMPGARFMVSVARREEKGSDVNVAAHLLVDVLEGRGHFSISIDIEKAGKFSYANCSSIISSKPSKPNSPRCNTRYSTSSTSPPSATPHRHNLKRSNQMGAISRFRSTERQVKPYLSGIGPGLATRSCSVPAHSLPCGKANSTLVDAGHVRVS